MKIKLIIPLALSAISLFSQPLLAGEKVVTLDVKNMTCAMCPITVKKSLAKVEGVSKVTISYDNKTALVTFDDEITNDEKLTEATTHAGYPSTVKLK